MLCQLLQGTLLNNSCQLLANQFIIVRPPDVALLVRHLTIAVVNVHTKVLSQ